jgi:hypothetical protein
LATSRTGSEPTALQCLLYSVCS